MCVDISKSTAQHSFEYLVSNINKVADRFQSCFFLPYLHNESIKEIHAYCKHLKERKQRKKYNQIRTAFIRQKTCQKKRRIPC